MFGDNGFFEEGPPCCDSPKISEDDEFNVCLNCGTVYSRILDNIPRLAFTQEEVQKRKSCERIYSPIGPSTFTRGSRDAKGKSLTPESKSKFNKLAKIHRDLSTITERDLWISLAKFMCLQKRLGITDLVAEDALRIYVQTVKEKLTMGLSIDTLLSASIFAALQVHGIPRTAEEIINIAQIPKKELIKSYRLLLMEILPMLGMKV